MERTQTNDDIAKDGGEGRQRKAEAPLGLSVLDLPAELLSRVLAHLTDSKDIVNVHLVNSKFNECASWDGVTGISFEQGFISSGPKLRMHSATAILFSDVESGIERGILRSFWKHCEKLEEITITYFHRLPVSPLSPVSSAEVRHLLSEIQSLQQEMPRKIRCLTSHCPDVVGSPGLLEVWQDSLRRIDLFWGYTNPKASVTGLDSTISALGHCAELREVTFKYDEIRNSDSVRLGAYKNKLPSLLDSLKNKRYLKVLVFRGLKSEEEYSKGRFKSYFISNAVP